MLDAIRRWRDEIGTTYVLGLVRVAVGLLLFELAWRSMSALRVVYFGDVFHWPILPEAFVPSKAAYTALVLTELLASALIVAGVLARPALLASAAAITYVLLCDRLQFHHNRWALACYAFLLSFTPCDRSFSIAQNDPTAIDQRVGPLWAARLAQLQVSIVYVASGGSKLLDPDWRGGQVILERFALYGQQAIAQGVPNAVVTWMARPAVTGPLSKLAITTELLLAVGLWSRRARVLALWWGVWFHLTIEATSRVEGFTWLTLAMYALFVTHDIGARKVLYDGSRPRGRWLARLVGWLDWFARFEVKPWTPDGIKRGHSLVVVGRSGAHATGLSALALVARCTPLLFPLWAPLTAVAVATKAMKTRRAKP
jgi:hypothetical protein